MRAGALAAALLALLLAAGPVAASTEESALLALVTRVQGAVHVQGRQGSQELRAPEGLVAGAELGLAQGAMVELALPGPQGRVLRLEGPGRFVLRAKGPEALPGTPATRMHEQTLPGPLRALRIDAGGAARAGVSMRGAPRDPPLPAPRGKVLPGDVHSLAWSAPPGFAASALRYEVRLWDDAGTLAFVGETGARELALPADLAIGRPGHWIWSVEAFERDRPVALLELSFDVPGTEEGAQWEAAEAAARADPSVAHRLVLAVALAQAGYRGAARARWPGALPESLVRSGAAPSRWHRAGER